eukprot:2348636-Pleurochrysis_carterae.AAC.1
MSPGTRRNGCGGVDREVKGPRDEGVGLVHAGRTGPVDPDVQGRRETRTRGVASLRAIRRGSGVASGPPAW